MGRKSNATKARIKNLPLKKKKEVEGASGPEDANVSSFTPSLTGPDPTASAKSEPEDDDKFFEELKKESDLSHFSATLQEAYNQFLHRKAASTTKRKPHYTGNSERSKRRWKQQKNELLSKGFRPMTDFFEKKASGSSMQGEIAPSRKKLTECRYRNGAAGRCCCCKT